MTTEPRDGPERAGKSKQTEAAETIPRDVGEFVDTVTHEARSIARLARGLCEADASQESAALIKRRSRVSDEGVHGASESLLDQPLGKILDKKNVHVAEDEAVSSVGNLATVIESRLKILHEFARAVQKRNILGTPQGLQFLDKHRAAHYPRIVPLVEPTASQSQLAEENARLKRENALIQEENDEFAHELGQRDADAELSSVSSSGQFRRHVLGIHLWIALPLGLLIALVLTAGISWSSAVHYYGVAEQRERERAIAQEYMDTQRMFDAMQAKRIVELMTERKYQDALIAVEALSSGRQEPLFSETRVTVLKAVITEVYGEQDMSAIERELRYLDTTFRFAGEEAKE